MTKFFTIWKSQKLVWVIFCLGLNWSAEKLWGTELSHHSKINKLFTSSLSPKDVHLMKKNERDRIT